MFNLHPKYKLLNQHFVNKSSQKERAINVLFSQEIIGFVPWPFQSGYLKVYERTYTSNRYWNSQRSFSALLVIKHSGQLSEDSWHSATLGSHQRSCWCYSFFQPFPKDNNNFVWALSSDAPQFPPCEPNQVILMKYKEEAAVLGTYQNSEQPHSVGNALGKGQCTVPLKVTSL